VAERHVAFRPAAAELLGEFAVCVGGGSGVNCCGSDTGGDSRYDLVGKQRGFRYDVRDAELKYSCLGAGWLVREDEPHGAPWGNYSTAGLGSAPDNSGDKVIG